MEVSLIQALATAQDWEIAKVLDSVVGTIWTDKTRKGSNLVSCSTEDYPFINDCDWRLTLNLENRRIALASYQRGQVVVTVAERSPRIQYA